MATNVPPVSFTPTGFQRPADSLILAGVQADINAAFGGALNPGLSTPQGQLASSQASIVGSTDDVFLFYVNQVDPAFATGRMQDALGRWYNLTRIASASTVLQVSCSGLAGLTIPVGALIVDTALNLYQCTGSGQIASNGSVTLSFAAVNPGPTAIPGSVAIYQAIPGWSGVGIISGVVGNAVESRAQFEARRQNTLGVNSAGTIPAVEGAVLNVPGVLDAFTTDNATNGTVLVGGTALAPNSIYVAAVGGLDTAVGQAIWTKKSPGIPMNGNTTVVVQDTRSGYSPPFPSYNITFMRPPPIRVAFAVTLVNGPQVPANALALVQTALLSAFAGGDGGPRARIGSTLYASRFVSPLIAIGSWVQVASCLLGDANNAVATVSGSIGVTSGSGTVLTVASVISGVLAVGQTLASGSGISGSGVILPGTQIVAQLTGTPGGVGTYQLSIQQTVPTANVLGFLANQASSKININQVPTLAAPDISLTLQ